MSGLYSSQQILSVELSAGYGSVTTLHDVAFSLGQGERVGLVGTSGAGKSTLVLALMGLLPWRGGWATGKALFQECNLLTAPERSLREVRGKRIALVPQSPLTALNAALSLQEHFKEAWRAHMPSSSAAFPLRMEELLHKVRLPSSKHFLKRKPTEISVGQAQRILIALALLHRPALLIADEPTSALDVCTQREVLQLLQEISCERETSLLYVSHDLISVFQICDRMIVMNEGGIVSDMAVRECEKHDLPTAARALLQTLPVPPAVLLQHTQRL